MDVAGVETRERAWGGDRRRLVVVGHGLVGHKLLETLVARGATSEWDLVTFCEEPRPAYDRVGLTTFFSGVGEDDLTLVAPGFFDQSCVELHVGDRVASVDRAASAVTSARGRVIPYDGLGLAPGSTPFGPPLPARDADGCFVYRTLDDVVEIR